MRSSTSYERFSVQAPIDGDGVVDIRFRHADRTAGWREFWASADYTLSVDGQAHATASKPAAGNVGSIPLLPASLPHGWHTLLIGGTAGETCYPWPVFVRRDQAAPDPALMPVVRGSFDGHNDNGRQLLAWVPARFAPVTQGPGAAVFGGEAEPQPHQPGGTDPLRDGPLRGWHATRHLKNRPD